METPGPGLDHRELISTRHEFRSSNRQAHYSEWLRETSALNRRLNQWRNIINNLIVRSAGLPRASKQYGIFVWPAGVPFTAHEIQNGFILQNAFNSRFKPERYELVHQFGMFNAHLMFRSAYNDRYVAFICQAMKKPIGNPATYVKINPIYQPPGDRPKRYRPSVGLDLFAKTKPIPKNNK